MRPVEIINARIEALHEGLNPAVRKAGGAQFALMLSMIAESQKLAQRVGVEPDEGLADQDRVSKRDDLYTPRLVGDLGTALKSGRTGDMQMLVSWLDTVPLEGRRKIRLDEAESGTLPEGVSMAQAALLAKRYTLLDEIKESRRRFAA